MLITKPGVLALLVMTSACASTTGCAGSQETAKEPITGIVAEFHLTRYNGRELGGRVLVRGAHGTDHLVIHEYLSIFEDVSLEKVRACGKTDILSYKAWDAMRAHREKDIVALYGGEWHGNEVEFPLYDRMWPWPDCMEADLVVRAVDGRVAARLPIRVERTDKPSAPSDGGAPAEPKPPASDGGAP